MSDNSIVDPFVEWNRQVNNEPGTVSQADATAILQTFGASLDAADGDAWWLAVAVEFNRLGIVNPPTYVGLRNWANNNELGANDLFTGLLTAVNGLPESEEVNRAIALQNAETDQTDIPTAQTTLEGFKTGDRLVDTALDVAIASLDEYNQTLENAKPGLESPAQQAAQSAAAILATAAAPAAPAAAPLTENLVDVPEPEPDPDPGPGNGGGRGGGRP